MACETGCREVQLIQLELQELWKELDKQKAGLASLQTDSVRSEERQIALEKSITTLRQTIDKMSEKLEVQLSAVVTEIQKINVEVQKQKARAEFTITWKEIMAIGISFFALVNAVRPYLGG